MSDELADFLEEVYQKGFRITHACHTDYSAGKYYCNISYLDGPTGARGVAHLGCGASYGPDLLTAGRTALENLYKDIEQRKNPPVYTPKPSGLDDKLKELGIDF